MIATSKAPLTSRELPQFIRDLLSAPPVAGAGLHQWLYRLACVLKAWRSPDEIASILLVATADCGRDTRREIAQAIAHAKSSWQPTGGAGMASHSSTATLPAEPHKLMRDDGAIRKVLANGFTEADLWEASPVRTECNGHPLDVLPVLFPNGDPLLCMGWRNDACRTKPLSEWHNWNWERVPLQFIVPSQMLATEGKNADGNTSSRALSATGARQYLVIEFDFKPDARPADAALLCFAQSECGLNDVRDLCASLIYHLAHFAPLALVVWSGGKSLHAWFAVNGAGEATLKRFLDYAAMIGADPATWTRNQFVRLPWGSRPIESASLTEHRLPDGFSQPAPSKSRLQSVLFFNPSVITPCQ